MIVVLGMLASAITYLYTGSAAASNDQLSSTQALYVAEAGLQRGLRRWFAAPATYTAEGPVTFGAGGFSVRVYNTGFSGGPLPASQRRIVSTGTAFNTIRTAAAIAQTSGTVFLDPFPNLANWPGSGPSGDTFNRACSGSSTTTTQATGGTAGYDTANAPGSTGGSFKAETNLSPGGAGGRLTGYREHTLAANIAAGTRLRVSLRYRKNRGAPPPAAMMMAVDLVAADGTVYRRWSNCAINNANWATGNSAWWTVPAGKTINRIRLSYDLRNRLAGPVTQPSSVFFDQVTLSAQNTVIAWR